MKKILIAALVGFGIYTSAQEAYKGKDDLKLQVGGSAQNGGQSLVATFDKGLGENMSFGLQASYLLGFPGEIAPKFLDRADLRLRFNANLGNVIGMPENMDIYPGLNLGTKNFGGHLGYRYFFTDGFGLYGELAFPFSSYEGKGGINNQVVFHIGASFNL